MPFTPTDNVVDDVMSRFYFEKARKLMVFLDWKWHDPSHVPSIEEIKTATRRLLEDVLASDDEHAGHWSGGFKAYKGYGYLNLDFCPVENRELVNNAKRIKHYSPMTTEEINRRHEENRKRFLKC